MAGNAAFLIKPAFNRLTNAVTFQTDSVNALLREEYSDNFGFFQENFGVYSYMRLTSALKYKMHYFKGAPLMWQQHNSCAWTPTGTLTMGTNEIDPCKVKINESNCYDEFFDSLYEAFLTWSNGQTVDYSAEGVQAVNAMLETIMSNATLSARALLTAGQLHDLTTVAYATDTPTRIEDAFNRTMGSCRGWIEMLNDLSATYSWTATNYLDAGDIGATGQTFTSNVVDLYDEFFAGAPKQLQQAISEGGIGGFSDQFYPLFLVSPSIHAKLHLEWLAQKESAMITEPRIRKVPYTVQTSRGARTLEVTMIDNTIVVPIHEVGIVEQYITGTSHFAYLTLSGVIQLGASFASLPVVGSANTGLMMQVSQNAEDYGAFKFLAHALMATAINDVNYITGDYIYVLPD